VARGRYFTNGTFQFLKDLKANNDREWFAEQKPRYEEQIKAPALRLIEDFAPHLSKLSPHFAATPRSLFRIHRDTRFAKDKSPYKTHVGVHFRHDASKNAYAPGYYLHIEPGSVFVGLGIWHPESKALRSIREFMVENPKAWKSASTGKKFTGAFELSGDRLSRPPKGFDANHSLIEDLKWKDFIGVCQRPQSFVTDPELPEELARLCSAGTPFMRFLCDALGVPF